MRVADPVDLREARDWYEEARRGLGDEFLLAAADALAGLEEIPERFPIYHNDFRRVLLGRFPSRIFYRVEGDEVIVFRILQAAPDHKAALK